MKAFYTLPNFTKMQVNQASISLLKETEVKTCKENCTSLWIREQTHAHIQHQESILLASTEKSSRVRVVGWEAGYCPHYRVIGAGQRGNHTPTFPRAKIWVVLGVPLGNTILSGSLLKWTQWSKAKRSPDALKQHKNGKRRQKKKPMLKAAEVINYLQNEGTLAMAHMEGPDVGFKLCPKGRQQVSWLRGQGPLSSLGTMAYCVHGRWSHVGDTHQQGSITQATLSALLHIQMQHNTTHKAREGHRTSSSVLAPELRHDKEAQ